MRDLLTLVSADRSADLPGLNQLGTTLQSLYGIKVQIQTVSLTNSADANGQIINRMDPSGVMQVFVFGNVALPQVTMFSPDGHNETITLASVQPWTVGSRGTTRPVGVVNLEGVGGFYSDYLGRLNDYLAGRATFERMGVADDHLVYRTDISPHGDAMQKQIEAAFGTGACLRYDSMDGDTDQWTIPQGGPPPYFSELGQHRPCAYGLFSGGRDKTALYYLGTAQAALQQKPAALLTLIFGSALMDFSGMALLPALLSGGLASVWTGYFFPDLSTWLAGQETLGEAILRHIVLYGWEGAINLLGFPGLMVPPPSTKGVTPLSDTQIATINASVDAKIAAMHDALQADYTAKIAAAVATMQTSQGQTGSPTTTLPATGTSSGGTPTTGTGATAPLVINCGAADSAYAKSGLLWTNQPTATTPIDVSAVSSPYDASFYRSGRGGPIALLSAGGYTPGSTLPVRLDFSEPHWASAGQRRFDVTLNGVKVLAAFDIFAAAGGAMNKAVSKSFSVVVGADGAINISLAAAAGSPDTNSYLCVAAIG